jgi:hypothetical protein
MNAAEINNFLVKKHVHARHEVPITITYNAHTTDALILQIRNTNHIHLQDEKYHRHCFRCDFKQ